MGVLIDLGYLEKIGDNQFRISFGLFHFLEEMLKAPSLF